MKIFKKIFKKKTDEEIQQEITEKVAEELKQVGAVVQSKPTNLVVEKIDICVNVYLKSNKVKE